MAESPLPSSPTMLQPVAAAARPLFAKLSSRNAQSPFKIKTWRSNGLHLSKTDTIPLTKSNVTSRQSTLRQRSLPQLSPTPYIHLPIRRKCGQQNRENSDYLHHCPPSNDPCPVSIAYDSKPRQVGSIFVDTFTAFRSTLAYVSSCHGQWWVRLTRMQTPTLLKDFFCLAWGPILLIRPTLLAYEGDHNEQ